MVPSEGGLRTLRMTHGCSVLSRSGPTPTTTAVRIRLRTSAEPSRSQGPRSFHGLPAGTLLGVRRGRLPGQGDAFDAGIAFGRRFGDQ